MRHNAPQSSLLPENIEPRKHEHIYAQSGWCGYKAYEVWVVALQTASTWKKLVSVCQKKLCRLSKAGTANFRISKHEQEWFNRVHDQSWAKSKMQLSLAWSSIITYLRIINNFYTPWSLSVTLSNAQNQSYKCT